jgi:hypothetical protein
METKNNLKDQWSKELVLSEDKPDWQNLSQTNQKKEKTQINKIKDKKGDIITDTTET